MLLALTRAVPRTIAVCELTHLAREPIDVRLAVDQHARYEQALADLGCRVERLPEQPDLPDSVFVEDAAVVLDAIAVITRPGAVSRRGETESVAQALEVHRPLASIGAPGTLDGGDVLVAGPMIYAGRSERTNEEGIHQLAAVALPFGHEVTAVDVRGCLHLKSAATVVGPSTVLVNPDWVDPSAFDDFEIIEVDRAEPFAGNALLVGDAVLWAAAFPRTAERLRRRGIDVRLVDASELAKAEGGLTCCSIILKT